MEVRKKKLVPYTGIFHKLSISYLVSNHSLTHSSLCRQLHEASTRDFLLVRFAASRGSVSMVRPLLFRSFRAVLLQVSFDRTLFLFPGGPSIENYLILLFPKNRNKQLLNYIIDRKRVNINNFGKCVLRRNVRNN